MSHWMFWPIGASINLGIVFLPMVVLGPGPTASTIVPLAVPLVLVSILLTLWVGCDISAGPQDISHYRNVKARREDVSWLPYVTCGAILLTLWVALIELSWRPTGPPGWPMLLGGGIVSLAGLTVRFLAIASLGGFFTEQLKVVHTQPLITGGIYRMIRHPSYGGLLLIVGGLLLLTGSVWGAGIYLTAVTPLVVYRVFNEEQVLVAGFGEDYLRYRGRTKRLIPLVF